VWDRSASATGPVADAGVVVAASAPDAVQGAAVVITMLPTADVVDSGARCPGLQAARPCPPFSHWPARLLRPAGGQPEFSVTARRGVMTERSTYPEDDPRHHTAHLREMLQDLVNHAREDIGKISEPKAQALFETTAEVCTGLLKAFDDYEKKAPAWR
jgi:hypothetical protein